MNELHELPDPIARKVLAKMRAGNRPAYVMLRDPSGKKVVAGFKVLNAGTLGGLIARQRVMADRAIGRFMVTDSRSSARTAAEHVHLSNVFTVRREQLLGQKVACSGLPFPVSLEGEVA